VKIVLAVCTYRRPDGIVRLLRAVAELKPMPEDHALDVLVIDNDTAAEGRDAVNAIAASLPFPVQAVHAAEQAGLSAARNRAAEHALSSNPHLIAFLDDDEWPQPGWLNALLRVQRENDSDAVGGPTRPVFPAHADDEQRANPYYGADMALPDGAACQLQAGGNVLVRAASLAALGATPFDPAFAESGSEDLAFFTALADAGARMHWAVDAIVNESVPDERLAPGWMRQRVINIANSRVRVMQRFQTSPGARLLRVSKTGALGTVAGLLSVAGLFNRPLARRAQLLRWKFLGKASAHLGRATVRRESYP